MATYNGMFLDNVVDRFIMTDEGGSNNENSGGEMFIITATIRSDIDTLALNKTYNEIKDALLAGKNVIVNFTGDQYGNYYLNILSIGESSGTYSVVIFDFSLVETTIVFSSDSADGLLKVS